MIDLNIKRAIVYGCGYAGKILVNYLLNKNIDVLCIMVSPGHQEIKSYETTTLLDDFKEIPILELNENLVFNKETVYVTVVAGKDSVINYLEKFGYKDIQIIDDVTQYENEFLTNYLLNKDVDITSEIMKFNNVEVYNPMIHNEQIKKAFFETFGDELVPGIFNDYSLVVDGAYENGEVFIKEGDYIIDAGANIGLFSCYAAEKGCTIYACEPGSKSLEILGKQNAIYDSIKIIPLGLSDESGQMEFFESDDCALDSIYMPRGTTTKRMIEVDTIDNLIAKGIIPRVDYIKADIEGAERYMLRGAVKTLLEMAPKLSICTYHYKDDPQVLEAIIKEANPNYVVEHKWRKLYAYVPN